MSSMTTLGPEALLRGFEPDFELTLAPRIPEAEFLSRVERMRRAATVAGHDALLVHADGAARYTTTNNYVQYACNWGREGLLVIPTDTDRVSSSYPFSTTRRSCRRPGRRSAWSRSGRSVHSVESTLGGPATPHSGLWTRA